MVNKIEIGITGEIVNGVDAGCFLRIDDDSKNTGGFLILTAPTVDFSKGYDNWVANMEELEHYFKVSEWKIKWLAPT
jgi:hypothetical protein